MRKILITLGVLALVAVLIVLIVPALISVDRYRPQIEARLKEKLGRDVKLGALKLHVIPLSVSIESITIGESPQFPSPHPFATANNVSADVQLFPLLRGEPVLDSLSMSRPSIELIRNANGVWNVSTLGTGSSDQGESSFTLKKLTVKDGQVGVTDHSANKPRTIYDHIGIDLRDYAPKTRFHVKLAAHLPGEGDQLASLDADIGPVPQGDTTATPIEGRLSLKRVSLSGFSRFLHDTIPPDTDCRHLRRRRCQDGKCHRFLQGQSSARKHDHPRQPGRLSDRGEARSGRDERTATLRDRFRQRYRGQRRRDQAGRFGTAGNAEPGSRRYPL